MSERKGFMLYHSNEVVLDSLSDADAGKLTKALMHYITTGEMPKLEGALYAVFLMMYSQIDRDREESDGAE